MRYLLDTSILAELRKPDGDPLVLAWFASIPEADIFMSVLAAGEIRHGIERLRPRDAARAEVFETWLGRLQHDYVDRMLPITSEISEEWGRMHIPDPVPVVDGLLAATARTHGMTLVTRNVACLAGTGVSLLNPFNP